MLRRDGVGFPNLAYLFANLNAPRSDILYLDAEYIWERNPGIAKSHSIFQPLRWILNAGLPLLIVSGGAGCAQSYFQSHITSTAKAWTRLDFNNDPDRFQFVVVSDRTWGVQPGAY